MMQLLLVTSFFMITIGLPAGPPTFMNGLVSTCNSAGHYDLIFSLYE